MSKISSVTYSGFSNLKAIVEMSEIAEWLIFNSVETKDFGLKIPVYALYSKAPKSGAVPLKSTG